MRLSLWPQSLFWRLLAASVGAVLVAQAVGLWLIAQERERFVLQGGVHEWSQRITETTLMLQPLTAAERAQAVGKLSAPRDPALGDLPPRHRHFGPGPFSPGPHAPGGLRAARDADRSFVRLPLLSDFEQALRTQLQASLGSGFDIEIAPTPEGAPAAIPIPAPFYEAHEPADHQLSAHRYDVTVRLPDGNPIVYRVTRFAGGAWLPRNLFVNLTLLVLLLVAALYVAARNITRPLSDLARAADSVGRQVRPAQLEERGARELRDAAHAFNTMQDRLRRYLDSRTRVLAAMSHDLKTPLTRLRLQVEALDDPTMQARIGRELDEMEGMVHEALALFRGLDDGEPAAPVDIDALLAKLRSEFTDMGAAVTVTGKASEPYVGKPQAIRRCLTNLVANAVKFGTRADIVVQDGSELVILVRDAGPGIPESELERVFEPFYRLESSRNRDSGGSGLGLSIARDIAQSHGGSLTLHNLPGGGLEARLTLPRRA
jgi:signal transduction histidine kinase